MCNGWDDEQLLTALSEAIKARQAVPSWFVETGKNAYAWHNIDAELAQLTYDSYHADKREAAVVRSETASVQFLTFTSAHLTMELEVAGSSLLGQVIPPRSGTLEIHTRAGAIITAEVRRDRPFHPRSLTGQPVPAARPHSGWGRPADRVDHTLRRRESAFLGAQVEVLGQRHHRDFSFPCCISPEYRTRDPGRRRGALLRWLSPARVSTGLGACATRSYMTSRSSACHSAARCHHSQHRFAAAAVAVEYGMSGEGAASRTTL